MTIFLLSMMDNLVPELSDMLRQEMEKRGNRVAYISSSPQTGDKPYYMSTMRDYQAISLATSVDYFDLGETFSDDDIAKLREYNIIYLSGGNTFIFLESARKRGLKSILDDVLTRGGLLIGASAGAIMCTSSIEIACSVDENVVGMTDFTAFGYVDGAFYPHANNSLQENNVIREYKDTYGKEVLVCKDGEGYFIKNGSKYFYSF